MGNVVRYCLSGVAFLFYFIYTYRNYQKLKNSILFTQGVKKFHLIAIWLVPVIWVLLLTELTHQNVV